MPRTVPKTVARAGLAIRNRLAKNKEMRCMNTLFLSWKKWMARSRDRELNLFQRRDNRCCECRSRCGSEVRQQEGKGCEEGPLVLMAAGHGTGGHAAHVVSAIHGIGGSCQHVLVVMLRNGAVVTSTTGHRMRRIGIGRKRRIHQQRRDKAEASGEN